VRERRAAKGLASALGADATSRECEHRREKREREQGAGGVMRGESHPRKIMATTR